MYFKIANTVEFNIARYNNIHISYLGIPWNRYVRTLYYKAKQVF